MRPERTSPALPWHLRLAAWACLVFSGLVGLGASGDLARLFTLSAETTPPVPPAAQVDPVLFERMWTLQRQALESMQGTRALLMSALVAFSGLSLVGAARMLWPAGMSREAVRRLLANTLLVVGVLRTIDGAQQASITRKVGAALADFHPAASAAMDKEVVAFFQRYMPTVFLAFSIGWTVLMAGSFVVLSQYLGSQRVRQLFAAEQPADDES